jgi:hypothetical protein
MITKLLHEHEGELHEEEIDYITNFTFTESYFYGLPKVHKSEVISNARSLSFSYCFFRSLVSSWVTFLFNGFPGMASVLYCKKAMTTVF